MATPNAEVQTLIGETADLFNNTKSGTNEEMTEAMKNTADKFEALAAKLKPAGESNVDDMGENADDGSTRATPNKSDDDKAAEAERQEKWKNSEEYKKWENGDQLDMAPEMPADFRGGKRRRKRRGGKSKRKQNKRGGRQSKRRNRY
jgi:hypothetical protein